MKRTCRMLTLFLVLMVAMGNLAAAADNNWHCDVCDRDNDMNFCPGCGAARPDEKTCEGCGYERPDDGYLFCPNCGQKY